jgi:hypothetical protein
MRKQFAKFVEYAADEMHHISQQFQYNTQNCRIWGAENPSVIQEKPLHARATAWCGFWAGGVIRPYFFRKWGRKFSNSEWRTLSQHDNGVFVASIGRYGYWRHVVPAGRRNLSHCARNNRVVERKISWPCHLTQWRSEIATAVVRFDTVRLRSFFGDLWHLVSTPTNHKQFLSSRRRFDVSLAKLSRNHAEKSSIVSSKEQECASRVVGDICRILCSTINRSVCTLYWI